MSLCYRLRVILGKLFCFEEFYFLLQNGHSCTYLIDGYEYSGIIYIKY